MKKLDSNAHSVFLLYYHLILVIKYRKKVLKQGASKEEANDIKAKLEAEGAKVTLK